MKARSGQWPERRRSIRRPAEFIWHAKPTKMRGSGFCGAASARKNWRCMRKICWRLSNPSRRRSAKCSATICSAIWIRWARRRGRSARRRNGANSRMHSRNLSVFMTRCMRVRLRRPAMKTRRKSRRGWCRQTQWRSIRRTRLFRRRQFGRRGCPKCGRKITVIFSKIANRPERCFTSSAERGRGLPILPSSKKRGFWRSAVSIRSQFGTVPAGIMAATGFGGLKSATRGRSSKC